uniref:Uncharacterized protein n=1 Tax=Lactuca sativa TaxID=4236 RepID=A0A9R1UUI6_LACSA|nr:hypothetical protein LSAT_V11C800402840 [Lactuca sativa]
MGNKAKCPKMGPLEAGPCKPRSKSNSEEAFKENQQVANQKVGFSRGWKRKCVLGVLKEEEIAVRSHEVEASLWIWDLCLLEKLHKPRLHYFMRKPKGRGIPTRWLNGPEGTSYDHGKAKA